ncbi:MULTISPECIES: hypothetical protein [unclassified Curtobacterium]|uniref:hypothetical protein n=1 Tax=unclassified Curtobacterium TaxID=257496 RepID=UPI0008DE28BA|nr:MULTISPECIES: hypothetical protein [unclassified Curtobacterium]WIA98213.1 hypothetical protein QOL16_07455 [Curtobacterium sp. MCBA15_004]WIB01467.1 hypothetical protein QOL15_07210 [Curtobacterium sp. MCBA15_012]
MGTLVPTRATERRRTTLLALTVSTLAVLLAVLVAPGPASASTTTPSDARAAVVRSIERGTVLVDIRSGALSSTMLDQVATTGFSVGGQTMRHWTDLTTQEDAEARATASRMTPQQLLGTSGDGGAVAAPRTAAGDPAAEIGESKHWWSNHEYFLSGQVVRTIVTVGAGVYLAAVCISLDLSKTSCTALGVLVAGAAEFIKSGGCGRGYWFDFPQVWKSHCG